VSVTKLRRKTAFIFEFRPIVTLTHSGPRLDGFVDNMGHRYIGHDPINDKHFFRVVKMGQR